MSNSTSLPQSSGACNPGVSHLGVSLCLGWRRRCGAGGRHLCAIVEHVLHVEHTRSFRDAAATRAIRLSPPSAHRQRHRGMPTAPTRGRPSCTSLSNRGRRASAEQVPRPDVARTKKGPQPKPQALLSAVGDYLRIFVTVPAPTVRPPSRMAKRRPSSMAMGWMSSTVMSVVSPGMTISVPSGSVMTPVTSVVRK